MDGEAFIVRPHMGSRRKRNCDTGLDAVLYKQFDWPDYRLIGLAERRPGADLIPLATLSESEAAGACRALAARECDGVSERKVIVMPPLEEDK